MHVAAVRGPLETFPDSPYEIWPIRCKVVGAWEHENSQRERDIEWYRNCNRSATFLLICFITVQFPRFLQLFLFWSLCFRLFSVKGAAPLDNQNSARQSIYWISVRLRACVILLNWFLSTLPPCYDIDERYVMWFMCFMSCLFSSTALS